MNINIVAKVKKRALELGFVKVGFTRPGKPLFYDHYCSWVSAAKNADMAWLEKNFELRRDPTMLLNGCKTIISLAYPYTIIKPGTPDGFEVSRYSSPTIKDYHQRLRNICKKLMTEISDTSSGIRSRICVDSAPLLERSIAYSSGMGFIGKNNMLIIPEYGSFFYLAEILTTAELDFSGMEPLENKCGSCRKCIDSCPTGALEKPFLLNASKCLSYLTIENKKFVNANTGRLMGKCFFGCDRCQEVCPFNAQEESREISLPMVNEFLKMTDEMFKKRFGETALGRAGLEKIKSNILAVIK